MTDQDNANKRPHSEAFPDVGDSYEPPSAKRAKPGALLTSLLDPPDSAADATHTADAPNCSTNGASFPFRKRQQAAAQAAEDDHSSNSNGVSPTTTTTDTLSSSVPSSVPESDPSKQSILDSDESHDKAMNSIDEDEAAQAMMSMFGEPGGEGGATASATPSRPAKVDPLRYSPPPLLSLPLPLPRSSTGDAGAVAVNPLPVRKQPATSGKKASLRDDINAPGAAAANDYEYFDDDYDEDGTYRDEDSVGRDSGGYGDDGEYQASGKPKGKGKRGRKRKEEAYDDEDEDDKLYCICKQPYTPGVFMIACDLCNDWYHGDCVGITKRQASKIKQYICPSCSKPKSDRVKQRTQANDDDFNPTGPRTPKAGRGDATEQRPRGQNVAPSLPKQRVPKGDVKCVHAACADFARVGSKYCSHECGIRYALEKIEKQKAVERAALAEVELEDRVKRHLELMETIRQETALGIPLSVAEQTDLQILETIEKEKRMIASKRETLEKNRAHVESQIEQARSLPEVPNDSEFYMQVGNNSDVYDCVSCGQSVAAAKLPRHMETCFVKVESHHPIVGASPTPMDDGANIVACDFYDAKTKTFCKKLKASCPLHSSLFSKSKKAFKTNAACGFPTRDAPSGFCELAKRDCPKHVNWESIKLAELVLEDISLNQALNQLLYDEKVTRERMYQRRLLRSGAADGAAENFAAVQVQ